MAHDFRKREEEELIRRFEENLKNNSFDFFDVEDYETIIHYYLDNSKPKKALAAVNQAMDQYPFSTELFTTKAQILTNLEEYDQALELLERARNLNPVDIEICLSIGSVLSLQGKHEEAIQSLKRSIAVNETWVGRGQNYATLALACHSLGHEQEARQWLSQTRTWLKDTNYNAASWTFGYAASDYLSDWLCAQVLLREAEKLLADDQKR